MSTTDSRPDHDSNTLLGLGCKEGLGPTPPACERCEFMLAATREAQAFAGHYADEVMTLRAKIERLDALLRGMQADAVQYLVPDNDCGADWFVSRMLWHLDGPAQRDAQDVGVANG